MVAAELAFLELIFLGVNDWLSCLGLAILAYQDYKHGEIHYRYLFCLVDFRFLLGYVSLLFCFSTYKYVEKYIGGADLLVISCLLTRYDFTFVNLSLIYACIGALIASLVTQQKRIKFLPFLAGGFFLVLSSRKLGCYFTT